MGLLCTCPEAAAPGDIPIDACPESVGQIQKALFQRIYSAAGVKNKLVIGTANPNVLATWTPLLASATGTKVVPTPYIQAPVTEPGAAREFGGGNETIGGIPLIIGREPTTFTGAVYNVSQKTVEAMKAFMCENIGVYLLDEYGRIIGLVDDHEAPVDFFPIPIASLFIGDKGLGGLESVDMNAVTWRFFPNWSDKLHIVAPTDFNALSDLVAP